jgi:predicted  nucleic acid-binding Zn-ribbon protein
MNDGVIQDLKQFIAATVRQEISGLAEDVSEFKGGMSELKTDMKAVKSEIHNLHTRIDDTKEEILDAIADTTNTRFEVSETDTADLGARVTKLEAA